MVPAHAVSGDLRWKLPLGSENTGEPAIGLDGTVYVGSWSTNALYAVNPNGQVRWVFQGGQYGAGYGMPYPIVGADGTVFASSWDGHIFALRPDGSLKWRQQLEQRIWDPVAVGVDGALYVSSQRADFHPEISDLLTVFNEDGSLRWQIALGAAAPMLAQDGTILMGTRWGTFAWLNPDGGTRNAHSMWNWYGRGALGADGTVHVPSGTEMLAYGADGSVLWRTNTDSWPSGGVSLGPDGRIYFITGDRKLRCLTPTGGAAWEFPVPEESQSTPAISAGGHVYFGCNSGKFFALTLDGSEVWSLQATQAVYQPVIAPDGTIYFGSNEGALYAVTGDGTGPAASSWPMRGGDARRASSRQGPIALPGDATNLQATDDTHTEKVVLTWQSAPGAQTYEVWRHTADEVATATRIASDIGGGTRYEDLSARPGVPLYYWVRGVNTAGTGAFSTSETGRRKVASEGEVVWRFPVSPPSGLTPTIAADGAKFLPSGQNGVRAYTAEGVELWRAQFANASLAGSPVADNDGNALISINSSTKPGFPLSLGSVQSFGRDGARRWQADFSAPVSSSPAVGLDGTIYVPTWDDAPNPKAAEPGLHALRSDGSRRWYFPIAAGAHSSPSVAADGSVFFAGRDGYAYALNPDGTRRWRFELGTPWGMPPVLAADGRIYVSSGLKLSALNQDGTVAWQFNDPDGHTHNPVTAEDGTLLFGASGARLVALRANGSQRWTLPYWVETSALSADGSVHLTYQYGLYLVDANGSGQDGNFTIFARPTTPVVIGPDGVAYFGADDGYCYGLRTRAAPAPSSWPLYNGDPQNRRRATFTLAAPDTPPPLTASLGTTSRGIELNWNSVLRAQWYEISRSPESNPEAIEVVASAVSGTTAYLDRSVTPEVNYLYQIRALNSSAGTELSAPATGRRKAPVPGDLVDVWKFDGVTQASPAIGPDGTVYAAVYRGEPCCPRWRIAALKPDGSIGWEYETSDHPISATPAIGEDGTIYVGASLQLLHAVAPDGTRRWTYDAGWWIQCSAALAKDGTVLVPTEDGRLHAVHPDGTLAWTATLDERRPWAPVIGPDGAIYVVSDPDSGGGSVVHAFNPDGTRRWTVRPALIGSVPPVAGPAIGPDGALYLPGTQGAVVVLNTDGTERRRMSDGTWYHFAPVLDAVGAVYSTTADNRLHAFNPNGAKKWTYTTGGPIAAGAALAADGTVYFGSLNSMLDAVKVTGEFFWQGWLTAEVRSAPVIGADGKVYVVATDGTVSSFFGSAPPANSSWPQFRGSAARTGRADGELPALTAPTNAVASLNKFHDRIEVTWASTPGAWYYDVWRGTTADFAQASRLVAGLTAATNLVDREVLVDAPYYYWVVAGNSGGGSAPSIAVEGRRRHPVPGELLNSYTLTNLNPVQGSDHFIVARSGMVLVTDRDRLVALNPDLSVRWERPWTNLSEGYIACGADGRFYTQASRRHLDAWEPDGTWRWRYTNALNAMLGLPGVRADGLVVIPSENRRLLALDSDGKLRWETPLPDLAIAAPVFLVDGTTILPCGAGRLLAFDPTGAARWTNRGNLLRAGTAIGADGLIYQATTSELLVLDPTSGTPVRRITPTSLTPLTLGPDGTMACSPQARVLHLYLPDHPLRVLNLPGNAAGAVAFAHNGELYAPVGPQLLAFTATNATPIWQFSSTNFISGQRPFSSPVIGPSGSIYVQAGNRIAAIAAGGGYTDAQWPNRRGDGTASGQAPRLIRPPAVLGTPPFVAGMNLSFQTEVFLVNAKSERIEFWAGPQLLGVTTNLNGGGTWTNLPPGQSDVRVEVVTDTGERYQSRPTLLTVLGPVVTAAIESESVALTFASHTNFAYAVLSSSNLVSWRTNVPALNGTGEILEWTDARTAPPGFFRVLAEPRRSN